MTNNPAPTITAPFQCEIEKFFNGEYWVNRYFLEAADLAAAATITNSIIAAERAVTLTPVQFTKATTRTTVQGDYNFITTIINGTGQRAASTDMVALYMTVRVDFQAAAGRPSRKYLRGVLQESDVSWNEITTALQSTVNTSYANVLAGLTGYVDGQGTELIAGGAQLKHSNRQLRRGSKKRTPNQRLGQRRTIRNIQDVHVRTGLKTTDLLETLPGRKQGHLGALVLVINSTYM